MIYELWDVESGNRLERFESEMEALSAARDLLALNGPNFLDALMLGAFVQDRDAAVQPLPPLDGDALLARIQALDVPPSAVAARHARATVREAAPS